MRRATTIRVPARTATRWLLFLFLAACVGTAVQLARVARVGHATSAVANAESRPRPAPKVGSASVRWPRDGAAQLRAALLAGRDEAELVALFASQAKVNAAEALAVTATVRDAALARQLRDAVLRAWAEFDADAAANWSMALPADQQISALDAVFAGSAAHPGVATALGSRLCGEHPELMSELGHSLEAALTAAKQFRAAVDFASGSPAEDAGLWLSGAIYQWAADNPEAALRAVAGIRDAALQENAYRQALGSWADRDAAAVATFALSIPAGPARDAAFYIALPKWAEKDPAAVAEWVTSRGADGDLDSGVAAIALGSRINLINPEVAIGLAEGIRNQTVRSATLRAIGGTWRAQDPDRAQAYINKAVGFRPEDLAALSGSADGTD
jgi:hypothetical protein